MPVSHTGDAGSNPARGAPRCDRGVRSEAHGVASAADRVRVPAVALDGAPGGQDGGLHPPERGSIPRGSTASPARSLKASPVGAATAAWAPPLGCRSQAHALGRAWWRGSAVSRVGRVRLPSRALTRRSSADRAPPCDGGGRRFESSRRDTTATSRSCCGGEADAFRDLPREGGDPRGGFRVGGIPLANKPSTTGRLGRRRSDMAVERGSIPRSSISP